ncbi:hypothetical protein T11_6384 [Trichinella zimbabwensis]|uniref:Uncharacterized protein n=1 Tax=Trichinella zimbabwensis TaxID=268475 RepID=A0A0V1I410_9BILA|nr:hypothetical protein T11_6384 [Trichinella zimbabwensis]
MFTKPPVVCVHLELKGTNKDAGIEAVIEASCWTANDPHQYNFYCDRIIRPISSDRIPKEAAVIVNANRDVYFLFVITFIRN